MRFKLLLLTTLAALVSSCSKNSSVVDDWPGIDELILTNEEGSQVLSPGSSFTLKSSLILPRMGKDVSFTVEASCDVLNTLRQKRNYKKVVVYKPSEAKSVTRLPVADILPEQVLIFPEFFRACHFALTAINQVGSTETEKLDEQRLEFGSHSLDFELLQTKNAYNLNNIHKLTVDLENKESFQHSKLTCLAGVRAVTSSVLEASTREIRGDKFILPQTEEDHPVENCIVRARDKNGKLLLSNRIQILNDELPPPPIVEVESTILDHNQSEQIFYTDKDLMVEATNLIELGIRGALPNKNEFFKMEEGDLSTLNLKVVLGLKTLTSSYDGLFKSKTYQMSTVNVDGGYSWSKGLSPIFTVSGDYTIRRGLNLKPRFQCKHPFTPKKRNAELGFIVNLSKKSKAFNIQKVIENDFTTDVMTTYNLLKLAKDSIKLNNLPVGQKTVKNLDGLSIFFRNNHYAPLVPLELSSKVLKMKFGENGEPISGWEDRVKLYPFASRAQPNTISCSSESEFTD